MTSLKWLFFAFTYHSQGNSEWEFIYMVPEVYEETDKDVGFNYTAVRWQVRYDWLKIVRIIESRYYDEQMGRFFQG